MPSLFFLGESYALSTFPSILIAIFLGALAMRVRNREICLENKVLVMGILNVTPDSFSDGGKFFDVNAAVERALQMEEEGADIIDIGGESTKPGAVPTSEIDEVRRVLPVIQKVVKHTSVPLSIDTSKAEVARCALDAGVSIVNDVTALRGDSKMAAVVAEFSAGLVLMHMQGAPQNMQEGPTYTSVVREIHEFFQRQLRVAQQAGINAEQIILDPGIGFGKSLVHNLILLQQLSAFKDLGRPLLIGPSRKSFIGEVLQCEIHQRIMGTAAAVSIGIMHGATMVRVHDVAEMVQVVRVLQAVCDANEEIN